MSYIAEYGNILGYILASGGRGSNAFRIVCLVLAIALAVVICVLVLPKGRRPHLRGFLAWLHEYFNFNILMVSTLLKILYIFIACLVLFSGIYVLFAINALGGLLIIIIGSVLVRLLYEFLMLLVIAANSLIQIRRAVSGETSNPEPVQWQPPAPAPAPPGPNPYSYAQQPAPPPPGAVEPRIVYCTQCGARYDANTGPCPSCGTPFQGF